MPHSHMKATRLISRPSHLKLPLCLRNALPQIIWQRADLATCVPRRMWHYWEQWNIFVLASPVTSVKDTTRSAATVQSTDLKHIMKWFICPHWIKEMSCVAVWDKTWSMSCADRYNGRERCLLYSTACLVSLTKGAAKTPVTQHLSQHNMSC